MRRFLACFVAAALLALLGSACSSTLNDAATIKYSLSGTDHEDHVTRADLIDEVRKIAADKPFAKWLNSNGYPINGDLTTGSSISAIWLSQLIDQKAIDALFDARHLKVTPAIESQAQASMPQNFPTPDAFGGFSSAFRQQLVDREARRQALIASYVDTSDTAGEKYFSEHESQFACASGKDVSHILVASQAAAQQILDQLHKGASFTELAKAKSTDTGSGAQGGALGCLKPNEFVAPFQKAADAAPFNTPVGPVHSQYGYHVILVTHDKPSYAASRQQVLQALVQQGQLAYQTALAKMLKAFQVHLDPRFGTWVTTADTQGRNYFVQPPVPVTPNTSREAPTTSTSLPTGTP
jgi:hypothetical protein